MFLGLHCTESKAWIVPESVFFTVFNFNLFVLLLLLELYKSGQYFTCFWHSNLTITEDILKMARFDKFLKNCAQNIMKYQK